jgi:hypothetical protein
MSNRPSTTLPRWPLRKRWAPVPAWRRYLRAGQAEEVLRQIIPGDPLRLRMLAADRITAAARLVDVDRVVVRAMARISHGAALHGPPASEAWLVAEMEHAIEDIVDAGVVDPGTAGPFLQALAPGAGVGQDALVRSCVAFNRRSQEERVAFWSIMLAAEPLEEAARRQETSPTVLARRSRSVLAAIMRAAGKSGAA